MFRSSKSVEKKSSDAKDSTRSGAKTPESVTSPAKDTGASGAGKYSLFRSRKSHAKTPTAAERKRAEEAGEAEKRRSLLTDLVAPMNQKVMHPSAVRSKIETVAPTPKKQKSTEPPKASSKPLHFVNHARMHVRHFQCCVDESF